MAIVCQLVAKGLVWGYFYMAPLDSLQVEGCLMDQQWGEPIYERMNLWYSGFEMKKFVGLSLSFTLKNFFYNLLKNDSVLSRGEAFRSYLNIEFTRIFLYVFVRDVWNLEYPLNPRNVKSYKVHFGATQIFLFPKRTND